MIKFILCEDGAYLAVANITRIWAAEDVITQRGVIRASMTGPPMPFVVAQYDSLSEAKQSLQGLVAQIEGESE